jgi:class 3 adenylate cyclase
VASAEAGPKPGDLSFERPTRFRSVINHVGDIIIDDNDIFDDGVNIAARLEGIAEPGGVCMMAAIGDISTTRRGRRVILLSAGSKRWSSKRGQLRYHHYSRRANGRCGKQKGQS